MLKILLAIFFAVSVFIAITTYGLAGVGLMGAGLAGGLGVAQLLIDRERRKFKARYTYFYDCKGNPVSAYGKKENACDKN